MENMKIQKTENNTFVVRADSVDFGKNAIVFESYNMQECIDYIGKNGVDYVSSVLDEFVGKRVQCANTMRKMVKNGNVYTVHKNGWKDYSFTSQDIACTGVNIFKMPCASYNTGFFTMKIGNATAW